MDRKPVLLVAVAAFLSLASGSQIVNPSSKTKAAKTQENGKSVQTFTGIIIMTSGKYILNDPTNKVTYELDDAKKVSVFVGKKVKVIGALDATKKLIHVESVQEIT